MWVQSHTAAKQRGAECKPRRYGSSLRAPNSEATLSFQAPTLQALTGRRAGSRALWERLQGTQDGLEAAQEGRQEDPGCVGRACLQPGGL